MALGSGGVLRVSTRAAAAATPGRHRIGSLCLIGPMVSDYRLSPALAARVVGLLTVGLAVVVFVCTALGAGLGIPSWVLLPVVGAGVAVVVGTGVLLRRTPAVHLDDEGYRVRLVRGAGVAQARWSQVTEVATTVVGGTPCVLLRLQGGRTTTLPAGALDTDRETFVSDLARHLPRGQVLPEPRRRPDSAAGETPL